MNYCKSIPEFLNLYFDKQGRYSFKNLDFENQRFWITLTDYCINNIDKNADLYALLSDITRYGRACE